MLKQKIIIIKLLVLAPLLALCVSATTPSVVQAATPPDSCFNFDSVTGTINDYYDNEANNSTNPACPKDVDIASAIGGSPVTSIGNSAFYNNQLTAITIPNSVTSIGDYAFSNNQLTTVTIPNSITSIGDRAFSNNQLTAITIPNSVTSIGSDAFSNNQLTTVTIPNAVTSIGSDAFSNNQLTTVTIPNSITSIGDRAFYYNQLTSVTIPNSVTSIGDGAFYNNQLTAITIPNSVTSIGSAAFAGNQLTTVNIPSSVTNMGFAAFAVQSTLGGSWETEVGSGDPARAQALMDRIWYARLYTADPSNPSGLADELLTEVAVGDLNGDGDQSDSVGGHLINPAQVTLGYENGANNQLQSNAVHTGAGLSDYLASSNPDNDFSLYYRLGSNQSFTPPAIAGFVAPGPVSLTLEEPNTPHTFVYSVSQDGSGSSDSIGSNESAENLASTGLNLNLVVLSALSLTLASSAYLLRKSLMIRNTKTNQLNRS